MWYQLHPQTTSILDNSTKSWLLLLWTLQHSMFISTVSVPVTELPKWAKLGQLNTWLRLGKGHRYSWGKKATLILGLWQSSKLDGLHSHTPPALHCHWALAVDINWHSTVVQCECHFLVMTLSQVVGLTRAVNGSTCTDKWCRFRVFEVVSDVTLW